MAFRRAAPPIPVVSPGKAMVASAAIYPVPGMMWRTFRFTDASWQNELWRLYDLIPEFHFLVNWVGGACGRVRMYAADVDDNGRVQQETDDKDVADLVDNMLGGPDAKAECIRSIAINLTVAGEVWIVGRTNPLSNADEWLVVSSVELRRMQGGYYVGLADERVELEEGRDLLIRAWTPHPRRMLYPDSPARAVYMILIEIEKLTRYIFAQMDSRLINAGVWFLPKELEFPQDAADGPGGMEGFIKSLVDTAVASLKGEGSAAGVVPTVIGAPSEVLDKIKEPIMFNSVLSEQAIQLREEALNRLSWGMDTPAEVLKGMGEANHWSAWHVDESTIKAVIEPLMNRIVDALTKSYFNPALEAMGKDPSKFCLTFDTSSLTVRPQRLQDTLNLNAAGIASDEAVLLAGDYKLTDGQDQNEKDWKWARDIAKNDPLLLQNPAFCRMAKMPEDFIKAIEENQAALMNQGPPPPPAPETTVVPHASPELMPGESQAQGAPQQSKNPDRVAAQRNTKQVQQKKAMAASVYTGYSAIVAAVDVVAFEAMNKAGKRLLTRDVRGRYMDTPAHEIHCQVPARDVTHARNLLAGSFENLERAVGVFGVNVPIVQSAVASYCASRLVTGRPYDRDGLEEFLVSEGALDV
jgi:hypothetical protein